MKSKRMKILWFINGPATQEQIDEAFDNHLMIRDSSKFRKDDFIESCNAVCGDVPEAYANVKEHSYKPKAKAKPKAKKSDPAAAEPEPEADSTGSAS